jgi:hypothetical protein
MSKQQNSAALDDVAKVLHNAKRRHLRHTQPMPKNATKEQRRVFLGLAASDMVATATIAELQGKLAKLFADQDRFNHLCE